MSRPHDMDKTDNIGDGDANGDGNNNDPSSQTKKKPTFLRNNFESYLSLKNNQTSNNKNKKKEEGSKNQEEWNHFITPLDPTREPPLPLKLDDNDVSSAKLNTAPSLFSDLERSQTVDRFANIFMERIGNVMSSGKLSQAWQSSSSSGGYSSTFSWLLTDYSSDANNTNSENQSKRINSEDYAAERRLMKPHLTPMLWGSSCVFLSLFSMRVGRWYQGRYVPRTLRSSNKTSHVSSQGPTNNNVKSLQDIRHSKQHPPTYTTQNNSKSPFQKELQNSLMSSLNTLPVDMALSMLFGISATIFLTRPHYLMKDLSDTPLLEGRSVLAEELCVPFCEEMTKVNDQVHTYITPYNNVRDETMGVERRQVMPYSDLWKDENLGGFESLRAIRDFCSNCQEREKVAKKKTIDDDFDAGDVSEQELMEMTISSDLFCDDGADNVE